MKKVLIVASVISFIEWFNQENILFLQKELGCEVHVACNLDYMDDTDVNRTVAYVEQSGKDGIIWHNIPFDRSPLGKKNMGAYRMLRQIINENVFDLIHCHTPAASVYTRLAARKARKSGTTVMYTCHGFHFHNASPKKNWLIYYPIERQLSRYCDYLVTICKEDYHRAQRFHTRNVRYIPGVGVDIKRFESAQVDKEVYKKSIGVKGNAVMILSVGELIERKNHEVIIKALSMLDRRDIYYVICGKGPLKEYLVKLSEELKVKERVIFLGFRQDIPELCKTADIGAFPSKIEGLGLAGIELMAAGIPLIASNIHGILDYVKNGVTGYACPPDDADAFASAIVKLTDDPDLRKKMKAPCQKAVRQFDKTQALNAMWKIYKEVL